MSVQLCYCWFRIGLWHNILILKIASNSLPRAEVLSCSTHAAWWFSDILSYSHVQSDAQTDLWSSPALVRSITLRVSLTQILRYIAFKGLLNLNHIQICSRNLPFKGINTKHLQAQTHRLHTPECEFAQWQLAAGVQKWCQMLHRFPQHIKQTLCACSEDKQWVWTVCMLGDYFACIQKCSMHTW